VRPYVAILGARFRTMLQYRAAALAGLWTQVFFGVVLLSVYEAFYASTDRPQPLSFPQVVSYVWLGQALLALLPWNADSEVRGLVRSGAVVYELCRPLDLYTLWSGSGCCSIGSAASATGRFPKWRCSTASSA
jgi:ABC-2 type transport system permease protein